MLAGTIESLAVLELGPAAAELYPLALELLDTGAVLTYGNCQLLRTTAGIAAAAGERWEEAEAHYQTALRQAHEIPYRSEQAEVRRWYARMLLERNAPADCERARTMLEDAITAYAEIGMPRHREMAQALFAKA